MSRIVSSAAQLLLTMWMPRLRISSMPTARSGSVATTFPSGSVIL